MSDDPNTVTPEQIAAITAELELGRESSHRLGKLGVEAPARAIHVRRSATLRSPPFELTPVVRRNGSVRIDERNWDYAVFSVMMYVGIVGAVVGWAIWDARTSRSGAFLGWTDIAIGAGAFLVMCGYFVLDAVLTGRILTIYPREQTVRIRGRGLRRQRWSDETYPLAACQWRVYRADVAIWRPKRGVIKFDGWMIVLSAADQGVVVAVLKDKNRSQEALARAVRAIPLPVVDTACEVSWSM